VVRVGSRGQLGNESADHTVGPRGSTGAPHRCHHSYAAVLTITRRWNASLLPRSNLLWIGVAGVLSAAAIAAQWTSYSLIAIAVAITLMQLSVPVVILTAPVIVGMHMERITVSVVSGALLIVAGSIIVVLVA